MRLTLSLAMLAAPAFAGVSLAECPTRAAMEAGQPAYVAYPDGSIVDMVLLGNGRVQETTRYGDHTGEFRMISRGGVFIVDEVDMEGDLELPMSRIVSTYPPEIEAHLPIGPFQEFSLSAVNSFADGTSSEKERIEVRTGGSAEIDIAGCVYNGFPMLLTYHWAGENFTSMMTHLPDLGVSLELARMDQGMQAEPFAPIHFSLVHP